MDIENKQLRETLEEYKSEFAEVKNQGENFCIIKSYLSMYNDFIG